MHACALTRVCLASLHVLVVMVPGAVLDMLQGHCTLHHSVMWSVRSLRFRVIPMQKALCRTEP